MVASPMEHLASPFEIRMDVAEIEAVEMEICQIVGAGRSRVELAPTIDDRGIGGGPLAALDRGE